MLLTDSDFSSVSEHQAQILGRAFSTLAHIDGLDPREGQLLDAFRASTPGGWDDTPISPDSLKDDLKDPNLCLLCYQFLMLIALADGKLSTSERDWLASARKGLGLSDADAVALEQNLFAIAANSMSI